MGVDERLPATTSGASKKGLSGKSDSPSMLIGFMKKGDGVFGT
jgi:hypothetical protein